MPDAYPAPHGATARRLEWPFLPSHLRAFIERRCGSPVLEAISQTSGFTPGFASVLVCADGTRHFVKAASVKAQRLFADSYRVEARKLTALPASVPAPRLLWHLDDDWVVLGIEHVAARAPRRPWEQADLDALLDALETCADVLTPPPSELVLDDAADDFAPLLDGWPGIHETRSDLDPGHLAETEALARRYAEVVAGDTLVHTDIRSDNVLIDAEGRAQICDWNWPVRGCSWFDSFAALIGPRGEGIDVDRVLATRRLLRDVEPEAFDINLALYVGYFFSQASLPVPPTSPHLRAHQRWQGEVCWEWLSERRGWA
ncbi:MAG: phosphotransferase [Nocardioides sp.]|nr:phosphotransferase [Nocardioides sp.]